MDLGIYSHIYVTSAALLWNPALMASGWLFEEANQRTLRYILGWVTAVPPGECYIFGGQRWDMK